MRKISVASTQRLFFSIQANCCWLHHALYEHRFCVGKTLLPNNDVDDVNDDGNSDDDSDNVDDSTGVGILFKKDKPAPNNLFSFLQVAINHFCHKLLNSSQIDSLPLSRSRWTCGSTWPPPTWASRSLCSCSQGSKMPRCFQQSTLVLSFKQANNQSNLQTDPVCVKRENVVFNIV